MKDLLLKGYKKDMRPVLNDSDKVVVKIGLSLSQIIDVVSMSKIFTESTFSHDTLHQNTLSVNICQVFVLSLLC